MQKQNSVKSNETPATPSPEDSGIYLFMDAVNETSCKDLISFIFTKNLGNPKPKHLQIVINSGGGDLNSAFAAIDVIKGSIVPIYTIGIGLVASAAFAIFISGKKGYRTLTPNTSIMSHQYTWGTYGKEHELFATVKEYELTTERMIKHYKKCTGLTEKKIREYLLPAQDIWLSAKEAKQLGICDKIKDLK